MSELVSTLAIAPATTADAPASLIAAPTTRGWFARLLRSPSALIGGVLLLLVVLMALSSPLLFPGDPLDMVAEPFLHPGVDAAHLLGSDMLGRDLLSGIFHGARVSLLIAVVSTLLALVLGISGGLLAGYYGGLADAVLMRVTEFFQTIPSFLFRIGNRGGGAADPGDDCAGHRRDRLAEPGAAGACRSTQVAPQ